jgi:hypothetical protein
MFITIEDFRDMFIEPELQLIQIYDFEKDKTLYKGTFSEVPENYLGKSIESIDSVVCNTIVINV